MTCGRGYECSPAGKMPGCGRHFKSERSFIRHFRSVTSDCDMTDDELREKGLGQDDRGFWFDSAHRASFSVPGKGKGSAKEGS